MDDIMLFFGGLTYCVFKGSIRSITWLLRVSIACTLLAALYSLPTKRKVFLNCSEPITNPIETIDTKVKKYDYYAYNKVLGRQFFIDIGIEYEGKDYELRRHEYIEGACKGMPAVVKLQKGARGLPIVQEIAIPEIGWSVNLREDTATESAIPML